MPIYKVNRKFFGHIMFTKQFKQIKLLSDYILDIQILAINLHPKSSRWWNSETSEKKY